MLIDLDRCIGCRSCMVACKAFRGTPPGVWYGRVLEREIGEYPYYGKEYIPVLCNHCEKAPCERVCPTGATSRDSSGIVTVDDAKCVGCRACYVACPYDNRFFLRRSSLERGYYGNGLTPYEEALYGEFTPGTVVKCDFCEDRISTGLEPVCVMTCPTNARVFGNLDDPDDIINLHIRERRAFQLLPEMNTRPSVYYVRGYRRTGVITA